MLFMQCPSAARTSLGLKYEINFQGAPKMHPFRSYQNIFKNTAAFCFLLDPKSCFLANFLGTSYRCLAMTVRLPLCSSKLYEDDICCTSSMTLRSSVQCQYSNHNIIT